MTKQSQSVALSERVNAKTHAKTPRKLRPELVEMIKIIGVLLFVFSIVRPAVFDVREMPTNEMLGFVGIGACIGIAIYCYGFRLESK